MTIPFRVEGVTETGETIEVAVVSRVPRPGFTPRPGLLTYTGQNVITPFTRPFGNPTRGIEMAQDVSFSGISTIIHAGVNSGNAESGTTDGSTTAFKLIQSGQNFNTTVAVGHSVKNTTDTTYARVTAVDSDTQLTLDADIMATGEAYIINPIWVGTATSGTWNFADSGKITITSANNNDIAELENDANQQWDVTNVTDFTGKVDLDTYNPAVNSITLQFNLNATPVGDPITLDDYIDAGNFAEQSFVIPQADFNFGDCIINGLTITIGRSGGAKPTIKFDDFQWEESGEAITYIVEAVEQEILRIDEIIFNFVDGYTGITTVAGATENATMSNLSYNKILGLTKLVNGINFRRIENNQTVVTLSFTQLVDFTRAGGEFPTPPYSDGTNTCLTVSVKFKDPIILYAITHDFMSLTINDSMNGLISFTAFARGNIEV